MWPFLGGLVSGGASLLGGLFQQSNQQQMLQQQEQFSAQQAQQQMDFQERMSDTQYQRGVADMKAAGINPILAAGSGGASSPSGAMAGTPSAPSLQNVLGNSVSSAIQGAQLKANLDNIVQDTAKKEADTGTSWSERELNDRRKPLVDAQVDVAKNDAALHAAVTQGMQADIKKSNTLSDFFDTTAGKALIISGAAGGMANSALSPVWSGIGAATKLRNSARSVPSWMQDVGY